MERTSSCMESDGLLTRHVVSKYAEKSSNIDLELSCLPINLLDIALAKVLAYKTALSFPKLLKEHKLYYIFIINDYSKNADNDMWLKLNAKLDNQYLNN